MSEKKEEMDPPPINYSTNTTSFNRDRVVSKKSFLLTVNSVIIFLCTIICVYECGLSVARYFAKETSAMIGVGPVGEATFLAFTICPRFEETYNMTALSAMGGIAVTDYRAGYFFGNTTTGYVDPLTDGFAILDRVALGLRDLMVSMTINTADQNNSTYTVLFNRTLDSNVTQWTLHNTQTFGKCFSVSISPNVTAKGITSVLFVTKVGIYVYMHHPGQFTNQDSTSKIYVLLGTMSEIVITHELTVNTLEEESDIPCNSTVDFNYDEHITRAQTLSLMKQYGCVTPFTSYTNGTKVCKFDFSTSTGLASINNFMNWFAYLTSSGQGTLGPTPCTSINVFIGIPFISNYNNTSPNGGPEACVKLNFKNTVMTKKTVFDYTWVSLFADLGGYSGLLLGVSILNITDTLDWMKRKIFRE